MTVIEAYYEIEKYNDRIHHCYSSTGRANNGKKIYAIMDECPEVLNYWLPTGHSWWEKAFICVRTLEENIECNKRIDSFDDGIDYTVPNDSGLYFIGETHFNPITREEFYWVKIGKSNNLAKRMKQYNTCCPMLWRIDFAVGEEEFEEYYHNWLYTKAIATCNHNEEWFLVDRETYLEMCEKGFAYFN
jgi:hypothetical protein